MLYCPHKLLLRPCPIVYSYMTKIVVASHSEMADGRFMPATLVDSWSNRAVSLVSGESRLNVNCVRFSEYRCYINTSEFIVVAHMA